MNDLRHAVRILRKNPGFTAVAVLTLALGIGANGTIFSLVNAVLLRPIAASNPSELVRITHERTEGPDRRFSYPDFMFYRDHNTVLSGLAATNIAGVILQKDGFTEQVLGEVVSDNYFSMLGIAAAGGRTFQTGENDRVAVISSRLRKRLFDSNALVPGKLLHLNGDPFTIIGILPEKFTGTFAGAFVDVWVPILQTTWLGTDVRTNRESSRIQMMGRLKPGVSLENAQTAMTLLAQRLEQSDPAKNKRTGLKLKNATLLHGELRTAISAFLAIVMIVVGLVLLTACANLANLLLMSATSRRREIAIRLALGASRLSIVRQFLTETLLLGILGGIAGLFVTIWAGDLLMRFNPIPTVPIQFDLSPDLKVYAFLMLVSLFAGVVLGLAPALQSAKPALVPALKEEAGTSTGSSKLRNFLVAGQVSVSMVLLIIAALFLQSLRNAGSMDLGFNPKNALAVDIDLQSKGFSDDKGQRFYNNLLQQMKTMPDIRSASLADLAPLDISTSSQKINVEGTEIPVSFNIISPGYFETLGIPLLAGRDFRPTDVATTQPVVIINDALARRLGQGQTPVGRLLNLSSKKQGAQIVGIADRVKYRTLGEDPNPHIYLPLFQNYQPGMTLLARTFEDAGRMIPVIQREVSKSGTQAFFARTLEQHVGFSLLPAKLAANISGWFGFLAVFLAMIGIYGAAGFSVIQRTREIGIRMALGAKPADVMRQTIFKGMFPVGTGLIIGWITAAILARLASGFLYGLSSTDTRTYLITAFLFCTTALLAIYFPVRRAVRTDPLTALRYE